MSKSIDPAVTREEAVRGITSAFGKIGVNAEEATRAFKRLSDALSNPRLAEALSGSPKVNPQIESPKAGRRVRIRKRT